MKTVNAVMLPLSTPFRCCSCMKCGIRFFTDAKNRSINANGKLQIYADTKVVCMSGAKKIYIKWGKVSTPPFACPYSNVRNFKYLCIAQQNYFYFFLSESNHPYNEVSLGCA